MVTRNLIFILGDQLSRNLASLRDADPEKDSIFMCEVREETEYVGHHKKKIAFLFSAMRHFAVELEEKGFEVRYVRLTDDENTGDFLGELERAVKDLSPDRILLTEPGEWRVINAFRHWDKRSDTPIDFLPDDRFLCPVNDFISWAEDRKTLRMEYFYRDMRRKTGLLMNGDDPEGGKWNFDSENRKPASDDLFMPKPIQFRPDDITNDVLDMIEAEFPDNFGTLRPFHFAVKREEALRALRQFVSDALPCFGDYQDAMLTDQKFLYHSILSPYINAGLLDPLEVCEKVQQAYHDGDAPLNAVEGFIRQIIGWREYVRGIYWHSGPEYMDSNSLKADRPLPWFYWSADTKMRCMKSAIEQTRDEAYAHHIQRLMITGNFALIAGIDPHELHEWYLAVYADASEWVEAPNTIGMSQFADGGKLASKPYASSGSYINSMSDYCENCHYSVSKKTGEGSCPFNSLYWHFLDRHRETLGSNGRLKRSYSTWDKMSKDKRADYLETADTYLKDLDTL